MLHKYVRVRTAMCLQTAMPRHDLAGTASEQCRGDATTRIACTAEPHPDLIVAQPDAPLRNAEAEDVVQEGLALGMPLGRGKDLSQHLLQQLQVRLLIKRLH